MHPQISDNVSQCPALLWTNFSTHNYYSDASAQHSGNLFILSIYLKPTAHCTLIALVQVAINPNGGEVERWWRCLPSSQVHLCNLSSLIHTTLCCNSGDNCNQALIPNLGVMSGTLNRPTDSSSETSIVPHMPILRPATPDISSIPEQEDSSTSFVEDAPTTGNVRFIPDHNQLISWSPDAVSKVVRWPNNNPLWPRYKLERSSTINKTCCVKELLLMDNDIIYRQCELWTFLYETNSQSVCALWWIHQLGQIRRGVPIVWQIYSITMSHALIRFVFTILTL